MIKSLLFRFDKFLHETQKAYLVRVGPTEYWLPKKLCRNFITNKKLGGNVNIPAFLYERITGNSVDDVPEADATLIITKHTPERRDPIKTVADASLTK